MKKNKFFLAGLPAIALALEMMVVGCDDGSTDDAKSGGGGKYPTELIGKWYTSSNTEMLEFTSAGKFFFSGISTYDASVSGKTITITANTNKVGSFDYAIAGNQMTISKATGSMANLPSLSPLTKK